MELGQGDIMVMDIRLLHHGTANQAEDPRTLLYVQYVQDFFIDRGNCMCKYPLRPQLCVAAAQFNSVGSGRPLFASRRASREITTLMILGGCCRQFRKSKLGSGTACQVMPCANFSAATTFPIGCVEAV